MNDQVFCFPCNFCALTNLLVCLRLLTLSHDHLYLFQPAHLLMYLFQYACPLLKTKHDILLHECKLNIARKGLQLRKLLVRLG